MFRLPFSFSKKTEVALPEMAERMSSFISFDSEQEEKRDNRATESNISKKQMLPATRQKIVGFLGQTAGVGSRTLSQTMAFLAAKRGVNVLYIEMNYMSPSFAYSSGLSHEHKNFLRFVEHFTEHKQADIQEFVASPGDIYFTEKLLQKSIDGWPKTIDFLTIPKGYSHESTSFPAVSQDFIEFFIKELRSTHYEFIVINLPPYLQHIFAFPMMLQLDMTYNVLTFQPAKVAEFKRINNLISHSMLDKERFKTIVNKVPKQFTKHHILKVLAEEPALIVPFDEERPANEWNFIIGSNKVDKVMGQYLIKSGLLEQALMKNKKVKKQVVTF